MISTLGEYMAFKKTIESIGVKLRALEDTDLEYSVYLADEKDEQGKKIKVYSSSISMIKSKDCSWMSLPVNMYLDDEKIVVELKRNEKVVVDEETWRNPSLALA